MAPAALVAAGEAREQEREPPGCDRAAVSFSAVVIGTLAAIFVQPLISGIHVPVRWHPRRSASAAVRAAVRTAVVAAGLPEASHPEAG
ncbi:hypothetical protein ACWGI8_28780 [Streptomyces sp. NPDC054841]